MGVRDGQAPSVHTLEHRVGNEIATTSGGWQNVAGTWRSELGSELVLVVEPAGLLRGTYRSAVGPTPAPQPLAGACVQGAGGSAVLGFVVGWPATGSLATWTGSYRPLADRIVATWLLKSESTPSTDWQATHLGSDVFWRVGGRSEA